jgi:hypothetical protein
MDAEDRVPLGFGDKRLQWSVWLRLKKRTGDRISVTYCFKTGAASSGPSSAMATVSV